MYSRVSTLRLYNVSTSVHCVQAFTFSLVHLRCEINFESKAWERPELRTRFITIRSIPKIRSITAWLANIVHHIIIRRGHHRVHHVRGHWTRGRVRGHGTTGRVRRDTAWIIAIIPRVATANGGLILLVAVNIADHRWRGRWGNPG